MDEEDGVEQWSDKCKKNEGIQYKFPDDADDDFDDVNNCIEKIMKMMKIMMMTMMTRMMMMILMKRMVQNSGVTNAKKMRALR